MVDEPKPKNNKVGYTFRLSVFLLFIAGVGYLASLGVNLKDALTAIVTVTSLVLGGSIAIASRNGK